MSEVARLLISLVLAAAGLTLLGAGAIWSMDEGRRIQRSFRRVLGEPAHALLIARGRGKGVGFNFTTNHLAVAWDSGAWCLVYRIEELIGAELVVDGQVMARIYRGEGRRALDQVGGAETQVTLRLVFDDARNPDFVLDLWLPEDTTRRGAMTAREAVQEANRWIARVEALLRRPLARRDSPVVAQASPSPQPAAGRKTEPVAAAEPPFDLDDPEDGDEIT